MLEYEKQYSTPEAWKPQPSLERLLASVVLLAACAVAASLNQEAFCVHQEVVRSI